MKVEKSSECMYIRNADMILKNGGICEDKQWVG